MNYGIELEFFVYKNGVLIPAYKATTHTDGNPIIGEIRTKIHNNIVDCVYELKKLIYLETIDLKAKGCDIVFYNSHQVDNEFLSSLRKDIAYVNRKHVEVLDEKSIYPTKKVGKILPRGTYKASLQINLSDNKEVVYHEYEKIVVEDKYKYVSSRATRSYSDVFDYISIIHALDTAFELDIKVANRVKGVYAIKPGDLGSRVEYRSLPNTVCLDKLIKILS